MQHTRPNVWTTLSVLLLLFPATCVGQQPTIKALMKYIDASRPMACPVPAPISDEFRGLSARTLQLKTMVTTIQSGLKELEEREVKQSTTTHLANLAAALDGASGTPGQEATICTAANQVSAIAENVALPGFAAVSSEKLLIDKTEITFPSTEVRVAATDSQFSISNTDKSTGTISIVDPVEILERDSNDKTKWVESKNFDLKPRTGTCSSAMTTGQNCQINVGFKPRVAGEHHARVRVRVRMETLGTDGAAATVTESDKYIALTGKGFVKDIAERNGDGDHDSTPSFRITAGLDASGSTSSQVQQKYYLDAALNAPIGWTRTRIDPLNRGYWWFFNPRITSVQRPPTALSGLSIQGFADVFNNSGNKTDLVQGVDLQGGIELCPHQVRHVMCTLPRDGVPFFTSYKNLHAKVGIYMIIGAGFTTPFASQVNNPVVFTLADGAGKFPSDSAYVPFNITNPNFDPGKKISAGNMPQFASNDPTFAGAKLTNQAFAFVLEDRSRFYRKYFVGYRLKTYHFSNLVNGICDQDWLNQEVTDENGKQVKRKCEGLHNAYPGTIDLTVGQDEQVTGGHLHGWVFRVDANYPLPFAPFAHALVTINSAFDKNQTTFPFIPPATSTLALASPLVGTVAVSRFPNKDLYRLGIGFDLLEIKNALTKKTTDTKQEAPPAAAATAGAAAQD